MREVPLLAEHPRSLQVVLAIVLPILYGALTGYFLGVSEGVYLVLSILGIVGALGAGYDHVGAKAGAKRGAIAGSLFGASILIAHEIHGASAEAHLPEPAILLVAVTTILAIGFAAIGGKLRERSMRERRAEEPPVVDEARPSPTPHAPEPAVAAATVGPATAGSAISLTTGSFDEYRELGMSVTQAKRVIAYRERDGGYRSVEDLDYVPGFSKQFLAELKAKLQL